MGVVAGLVEVAVVLAVALPDLQLHGHLSATRTGLAKLLEAKQEAEEQALHLNATTRPNVAAAGPSLLPLTFARGLRNSGGLDGGGNDRSRVGQRLTTLAHDLEVAPHGFPHLPQGLLGGVTEGHASRQIWGPRTVAAIVGAFNDDRVRVHGDLLLMPACFRMLRSVPIGKSLLGLPDTVTTPGLLACT